MITQLRVYKKDAGCEKSCQKENSGNRDREEVIIEQRINKENFRVINQ